MRLDGLPSNTPAINLPQANAGQNAAAKTTTPSSLDVAGEFKPTGDFESLLQQLQAFPAIREQVVAQAAAKLNSGELNSPEAKAETIQAILASMLG